MAEHNGDKAESHPSHVFIELSSLAELCFPTLISTRTKYTCLTVSSRLLAIGSSSGSVYLFCRYAAKLKPSVSTSTPMQLVKCPEEIGAVSNLLASPDERFIAVAGEKGLVGLIALQNSAKTVPECVVASSLHAGQIVTAVCWSCDSQKLLIGDQSGKITVFRTGKTILRAADVLLQLDSSIVQIDARGSFLLISTLTRTYLHDLSSSASGAVPIGRASRHGPFGACFLPAAEGDGQSVNATSDAPARNDGFTAICSRPSGRLWEADLEGKVGVTHCFDAAHASLPQTRILQLNDSCFDWPLVTPLSASVQFGKLHLISKTLILCISPLNAEVPPQQQHVLVIDVRKAKILLVAELPVVLTAFACCDRDLFLLTADGSLRKFSLYPIAKASSKLYLKQRFLASAQLIHALVLSSGSGSANCDEPLFENNNAFTALAMEFPAKMLNEILVNLSSDGKSMADAASSCNGDIPAVTASISALLKQATTQTFNQHARHFGATNSRDAVGSAVKLSSGIHKVLRPMENSGYEDDFVSNNSSLTRLNLVSKSELPGVPNGDIPHHTNSLLSGNLPPHGLHHAANPRRRRPKIKKVILPDASHNASDPSRHAAGSFASRNRTAKVKSVQESNRENESKPESPNDILTPDRIKSTQATGAACSECGLSQSWRNLLLLGHLITFERFAQEYADGGPPRTVDDWSDLLTKWCELSNKNVSDVPPIASSGNCSKCRPLLERWPRKPPPLVESPPSSSQSANEDFTLKMSTEELVRLSKDPETVKLFSPLDTAEKLREVEKTEPVSTTTQLMRAISKENSEDSKVAVATDDADALDCSLYFNPVYASMYVPLADADTGKLNDRGECEKTDDAIGCLSWLKNFKLDQLISLMLSQTDAGSVMRVVDANDEILKRIHSFAHVIAEDILRKTTRKGSHPKFPVKLTEALAADLKLEGDVPVIDYSRSSDELCHHFPLKIPLNSPCIFCALPMTAMASAGFKEISVFKCGHICHKVCAVGSGKNPDDSSFNCLLCDLTSS